MNAYLADLVRNELVGVVIATHCDKDGTTDSVCPHTLPAIIQFDKALSVASLDAHRCVYSKNLSSHLARYQNQSKYFHGYNQ